jgi:hypothetical protein
MGFKLKNIASLVAPVTALTAGFLGDVTRSRAPNLPGAPDPILNPEVPNFTPEELDLIQQRRAMLDQYKGRLNEAPTAYDQSNDQIAQAENERYLQALKQQQGELSIAQKQARNQEFNKLVEAAGRRGIRILGDDPSSATSDSTAGNQILSEFNKRYSLLADEQRRGDLSFGGSQNLNRLGLTNQNKQNYFNNSLNLNTAYGGLQDVYGGQRSAIYNRDLSNIELRNQALLNNYNTAYNQATLNADAKNQTRSNRIGLFNSALQAGATIYGGKLAGGAKKTAVV